MLDPFDFDGERGNDFGKCADMACVRFEDCSVLRDGIVLRFFNELGDFEIVAEGGAGPR